MADAHPDAPRYTNVSIRHGTLLATILFRPAVSPNGAVNELPFFAEFGKPEIKFICNHDAMLTLTITRGHIRLGPEHGRGGERR